MTEKDIEIQELRWQRNLLLQENVELREKQRWIPVAKKLPENEPANKYKKVIKCLVFVESPFPHGKGTVQFRQREIVYDLNGVPEGWKWSKVGSLRVTHWMPLPEVPEVGEWK